MRVSLMISMLLVISAVPVHGQTNSSHSQQATIQPAEDPNLHHPLFRHPTFQQAWEAAQVNQCPIFLYVTSDNCRYCKKMLRETLTQPQVGRVIADHAEPYAFNATTNPELAQKLGVRGYPTTLVISPDRQLMCQIEGFVEPQEFMKRIKPIFQDFELAQQASYKSR